MSDRIEIPLAQGWARGLVVAFETEESSKALDLSQFFHVSQVHGAAIHTVAFGDKDKTTALAEADGLLASGDELKKNFRPLLIKTADCIPLIFVDAQSKKIAAVHAGWRGLKAGIHRLLFLKGELNPKTTWAWVGPCLNGSSFEVGADVWSNFCPTLKNPEEIFTSHTKDPAKRYFQSWRFIEQELKGLGVELVYNVEVDTLTKLEFASYRRNKMGEAKTARNFSWVGFKDS